MNIKTTGVNQMKYKVGDGYEAQNTKQEETNTEETKRDVELIWHLLHKILKNG